MSECIFQEENDEFWCHMKSPLVHHVGWSQTSGHKLHATQGQYLSMYTCIIFLEYVNLHLGDFQKNEDFVWHWGWNFKLDKST